MYGLPEIKWKKEKKYFKKEKLINVYNAVHRSSKRDMKKWP